MILGKSDGTTLQEHLNSCILVCCELKKALPYIAKISKLNDFNNLLITAILFHDFGKIHPEFQKMLMNQSNHWEHQRHEIYSVIFTNKIELDSKKLQLIQKAILAHHRSFDELKQKYQNKKSLDEEFELYWKFKGLKYHPHDLRNNLANIKRSCIIEIIDFIKAEFQKHSIDLKMNLIKYKDIAHPVESIALSFDSINFDSDEYLQNILFWGALKMCDHYGSAGIDQLPVFEKKHFHFLDTISEPYTHQKIAWDCDNNVILIAPTGSGKTESAIGWLRNQLSTHTGRVYYILPYTASINAMHKRLAQDMEKVEPYKAKVIGIQHGKLAHYLTSLIESKIANTDLIKKQEVFKKLIHPFRIITPFQILKYFFGVRGFEIGFVNLCGAILIFDEIHAYDTATFAQIIVMLEFLINRFECKVFIMTATLPTFIIKEIKSTLIGAEIIKPENNFLETIQRHKIEIYTGDVFEAIINYQYDLTECRKSIIVCNTVAQAQNCYQNIILRFPDKKVVLLHSRFNSTDRMEKEQMVFEPETDILIGTQAIEVSLDIDYDMMITEPAPLDALLQRFGRINRYNKKPNPATVIICDKGGSFDHKIYPAQITERTMSVLKKVEILVESLLQNYLDQVYPDWTDEQRNEYEEIKILFKNSLASLQPYSEHKENEEAFYEQFKGIQVLPAKFFAHYKSFIEQGEYLKAEELLVGIHQSIYRSLKHHKDGSKIVIEPISIIKKDRLATDYVTVALCKYSEELGLITSEFENINYGDDLFI
ncbi:MAG: CRISPR-associated helicase Cas3' [Candidatus Atribacteria bacterium]|nr:CRISPR-associated helicase Cas3' [Candidatus Atribacteria bacterium]